MPGQSRFVTWSDLAGLPTTTLEMDGEFVAGTQEVQVLKIEELVRALPLIEDADTLLAWCTDGYFSIYNADFLATEHPFIVLAINEEGPTAWPPAGLQFNPGPYVITVSEAFAPSVSQILDVNHKKPWGSKSHCLCQRGRIVGTGVNRGLAHTARTSESGTPTVGKFLRELPRGAARVGWRVKK